MSLKALASRIARLERRTKNGDCDGCNQTAMRMAMEKSYGATCPDCGNPHPKISIRCLDQIIEKFERRS